MRLHRQNSETTTPRVPGPLRLVLATTVAILGLLSLAPAPATAGDGRQVSQAVHFRIVVPPVLRIDARRQPARLVVTARDVAAGFVDVERAVEVEVQSNLRAFAVQLRLVNPLIRAGEVTGLGEALRLDEAPASIGIARAAGRTTPTTLNLGFRLRLDARLAPGEYPWPVALTVVPV